MLFYVMLITYTSMFGLRQWQFALELAFAIVIINFFIGIIYFFCKAQSSQFIDIEVTQSSRIPTFDNVQLYLNSGVYGWRRSSIPNNLEFVQHQRSHSAMELPSDLPPSYFEIVTSKRSETPPPQYYNIFCESSV